MILNSTLVRIGSNPLVDEGSIIGYKPSRDVGQLRLSIGDNCLIRYGTVIYLGSRIGDNLETGHNVILREENEIGDDVKVWSNSIVDYGCKVGHRVKIHSGCYLAQLTVVEDDVFIAPGVTFSNEKYPTGTYSKASMRGPIVKRDAKIGVNSTILPGISIGEGAIVGAGSVVTRDVAADTVVWGVPARKHKNTGDLGVG